MDDVALNDIAFLGELGWVRAMARGLLADPNDAEDITQEVWLKAHIGGAERFPSLKSLRAWLAAVTQRMARDTRRARQRRVAREERAARSESVAEDVVERSALVRALLQAVSELDEPCRSTVLLRYMDGHSIAEVAAELSITEEAVRKRLSRGLARLRVKLEVQWGSAFHSCLLGLAESGVPVGAGSGLALVGKLAAAAGAVVCGLVGARAWIAEPAAGAPAAVGTAVAPFTTSRSALGEMEPIQRTGREPHSVVELPRLEVRGGSGALPATGETHAVRAYQLEQSAQGDDLRELELELQTSVSPDVGAPPPADD
mgnify:FL=1